MHHERSFGCTAIEPGDGGIIGTAAGGASTPIPLPAGFTTSSRVDQTAGRARTRGIAGPFLTGTGGAGFAPVPVGQLRRTLIVLLERRKLLGGELLQFRVSQVLRRIAIAEDVVDVVRRDQVDVALVEVLAFLIRRRQSVA